MPQLLLSPPAVSYIPVLFLHLVSLGYLLLRRPQSRQSWLFCGWLGGMTAMVVSQCAAWSLYGSTIGTYFEWWGGVGCVSLAIVALIQFAYAFPRPRYEREARIALAVSVLITGGLFGLMALETLASQGHRIYATTSGSLGAAFEPRATWIIYDFERFCIGFTSRSSAGALTSFRLFDLWQSVGNLWVLVVWLRKTVQFSQAPDGEVATSHPRRRRLWEALRRPRGKEARVAHAWVMMMFLYPLPVVASILDGSNLVPPGTFAIVHLLVLLAIMFTYVNGSPEPTTFMAKLVSISLVTILTILGLVSNTTMIFQRDAYTRIRRAELGHVAALIEAARFDTLPPDILYVAARPTTGLFSSEYRIITARPGAPDAAELAAHDKLLREGLARTSYPAYAAVRHEYPWLGPKEIHALEGPPPGKLFDEADPVAALQIPPDVTSYRGSTSDPDSRFISYVITQGDTSYEVGYDYLEYRRYLHRAGLVLVALMAGSTLVILVILPRFFHVSLVAPLMRLLDGVNRVNGGELSVEVPIWMRDEIGDLTAAFNRMVGSLRDSQAQLRTLNLTLEQRVLDRTRDLATLYRVASLVSAADPLNVMLDAALAQLVPAVDGIAGVIMLREPADGRLRITATHGIAADLGPPLTGAPFWRQACDSGEPVLIHNLKAGTDMDASLPFATVACVPIPGRAGYLGALALFGRDAYLFNVEDLGLLGTIAEQLGIAIENARLREQAASAIVLEERQRLARDLHDSVTQLIYSQTLFARAAARFVQEGQLDRVEHCVTRLGEAAYRALREMRLMIYRLRPADLTELGLVGALQRRLELVEQRAGIRTTLLDEISTSRADHPIPVTQERALFQIAEEALTNALKHSAAAEVRVELRCEDHALVLCVTDDGCGFDIAHVSHGLGIQNLHERAAEAGGKLIIETTPGAGTRVVVRLPIQNDMEKSL